MIRLAIKEDIETLNQIARRTVNKMHEEGLDQWSESYPGPSDFENDILHGRGYVFINPNILGYFAFIEHDPYYDALPFKYKNGVAIHRVLIDPIHQSKGHAHTLFQEICKIATKKNKDAIWIDTHPANTKMQKLLKMHQFKEKGFIDEIYRIAYERPTFIDKPKRILIFGNAGTGKTTLSRILEDKLHLSSLHLDTIYWQENWQSIPRDLFYQKLKDYLDSHANFVIDGNYLNADILDLRLKKADTLLFLDYKTQVALNGIKEREKKYGGKVRSDMALGCVEKIDQEFLSYVLTFNETRRPQILKILSDAANEKNVLRFETRKSLNLFLETL